MIRAHLVGFTIAAAMLSRPAVAQTAPVSDNVACSDSASSASSYSRCALMLDRQKLRRGAEAVEIARFGLFHPIPIDRYVVGDSAHRYARSYARNANRSLVLTVIGAGLMTAAFSVADWNGTRYDCIAGYPCHDTRHDDLAAGLLLGGAGVTIISVPFQLKAQSAAARAVWWNNLRFAR